MSFWFAILTILFIGVSIAMVLIILVQRPQGGGLAGAFGGASGGGTDSAFGGRTGDALTAATVATFVVYLVLALGLNIIDNRRLLAPAVVTPTGAAATPAEGSTTESDGTTGEAAAVEGGAASTGSADGSATSGDASSSSGSAGTAAGDTPATVPPTEPAK